MAKLILTQEERDAHTWFELPDETIGKLCKAQAIKAITAAEQANVVLEKACVLLIISHCEEKDIEEVEYTLKLKNSEEWIFVGRKIVVNEL